MPNLRLTPEITEFMEKYAIDSDEIWQAPGGKAWVVKHKALERVASEQKISFERPTIISCDLAEKSMVICVFGKMGEREEWTFGEASPSNNKNAYFAAMTEKRAKDRVILKLLAAHGELYSSEEADDFKRPNPHVTRPEDIHEPIECDDHGHPVDNIPPHDPDAVRKLRVADQRPVFAELQKEIHATTKVSDLQLWAEENRNRLGVLKPDWQQHLRGVYAEHLAALRQQELGDDMRMAG
jgi:hypothetical protein